MHGPSQRESARVRVVNVVAGAGSWMGGVASWACRMPEAMRAAAPRYHIATLWVQLHPMGEVDPPHGARDGDEHHACVIDSGADHVTRVRTLVETLERLSPSAIIVNHADIVFMAAGLLRARGVRLIAAARSDEPYVRSLLRAYPRFDGGVGVSAACLNMLRDVSAGVPLAMTASGAPVAPCPRTVSPGGPIRLAYVGRLAQTQKRIMDVPGVLDGLHARAVAFEMDIVGDGPQEADLRRAIGQRPYRDRVRFLGRRTPDDALAVLARADALVLVSDYEGTSIAMLEAMGQGVVPVVTDVSCVRDWVTDGENGLITPIGEPDAMAHALTALAGDRARLARMGRNAWSGVRERVRPEHTARVYADVLDRAMAAPMNRAPTDCWLQPMERGWWTTAWCIGAGDVADEAARGWLAGCGFARIAAGRPAPGCDAVLVGSGDAPPTQREVDAWRMRGLGVAISPTLRVDTPVMAVRRVIMRLRDEGFGRIALYGAGAHTRKVAAVAHMGLPLVGVIDDAARPGQQWEGLPVVPARDAAATLQPDAVVLSSDTIEDRLWCASAPLRRAGVRVEPVYGRYDDARSEAVAA